MVLAIDGGAGARIPVSRPESVVWLVEFEHIHDMIHLHDSESRNICENFDLRSGNISCCE